MAMCWERRWKKKWAPWRNTTIPVHPSTNNSTIISLLILLWQPNAALNPNHQLAAEESKGKEPVYLEKAKCLYKCRIRQQGASFNDIFCYWSSFSDVIVHILSYPFRMWWVSPCARFDFQPFSPSEDDVFMLLAVRLCDSLM